MVGALGGVDDRDSVAFLGTGLPLGDWPTPPAPAPGLEPRILARRSATDGPEGAADDLGGAGVGTAMRGRLHGQCVRLAVANSSRVG